MNFAERLVQWNRWYDGLSEWRFRFVVWSLLALGAINMFLTVAVRFPFALLVVLGIIAITAVRVPYVSGWITREPGDPAAPRFEFEPAGWVIDINRRYDAMPELQRMWVYPTVLVIAGMINMLLTIAHAFPFGLLFLIVLLAMVAIRAPYVAGWYRAPSLAGAGRHPELPHTAPIALAAEPGEHPVSEKQVLPDDVPAGPDGHPHARDAVPPEPDVHP